MDKRYEYKQWLDNRYNYTAATKKNYFQMVKNLDFENLERELLQMRSSKADKTFNLSIAALKSYAKFLREKYPGEKLIEQIESLEAISSPRSNPHPPYSKDEVQKILEMARGWRRTALAIAFFAGLRQGEIRKLNRGDIDLEKGIIHVVEGKGRKSRKVLIGRELSKILEEWIQFRDLNTVITDKFGDPLLINRKAKRPVLASGNTLKTLSNKLGFKVVWHRCRATYATRLYQLTKDVKLVQHQLGHSNSSTTDRYIQLSLQEIHSTISRIGEMYR